VFLLNPTDVSRAFRSIPAGDSEASQPPLRGRAAFLDLCEAMGLDPQAARPRFRAHFKDLVEELLR